MSDYLIELRQRVIRSLVVIGVVFAPLCFFAKELYSWLALPLLKHLPEGSMIATGVVAPFWIPFKFASMAAIFIAMPYLLQQIWGFVAPALYHDERRFVWMLLVSSSVLFYLGVGFAYFIIFPLLFHFFVHAAPVGIKVMPDISQYLDFVLKLFFAFGLAFEVPVATVLVVRAGICTEKQLRTKRAHIIIAALVIGMLLTPPDIISQILLALPMWLLFETGLLLVRFAACYGKPRNAAGS